MDEIESGSTKSPGPGPLGDFIRQQRVLKRWSQRDLGQESGVSHSYIANLERGFDHTTGKAVNPSIEKLTAVAKGLGVDPDVLLRLARGFSLDSVMTSMAARRLEAAVAKNLKQLSAKVVDRYKKQRPLLETHEEAFTWLVSEAGREVANLAERPYLDPDAEDDWLFISHTAEPVWRDAMDRVDWPKKSLADYHDEGMTPEEIEARDRAWAEAHTHEAGLGPLPDELRVPDDAPEPPDEWELGVLEKIGALDYGQLDPRRDRLFWYEPKEARRRVLRNLEDLWFEREARIKKGQRG